MTEPGLEQTVLECAPHSCVSRATGEAEEVLFVVAGRGELRLGDERHALEPETGVNLGPGEEYEVHNEASDPMRMVCVRIRGAAPPEELGDAAPEELGDAAPGERGGAERLTVRRLAELAAQDATTDRSFRIVADPSTGLRSATHFVGYVPPARAPDHFHTYDEVIYVLEGEGAFHVGGTSRPIGAGSCIELPGAHRALSREHRPRRVAPGRRVPAARFAGGGVLPGRNPGVSGDPGSEHMRRRFQHQ